MSMKPGSPCKPPPTGQTAHLESHSDPTEDTGSLALSPMRRWDGERKRARSDAHTRSGMPHQPPRERGTWCAVGLAVALHAVLATLVFSGMHGPHHTNAISNTVVTGHLVSLPRGARLPPITAPTFVARTPPRPARLAARTESADTRHWPVSGIGLHHARVGTVLAVHAINTPPKPLALARRRALPPNQAIERVRATRLAALKALAGSLLETNRSWTGNGAAVSPGYADKVVQRVRAHILAPFSIRGDPSTVVAVTCTPTGALLSVTVRHSSGNPQWDRAVLSAVEQSDPLPGDVGGTTPTSFLMTFQPRG